MAILRVGVLIGAVLLAGCSHDLALDRPCGDSGKCPEGQTCSQGVCVSADAALPEAGPDRGADQAVADRGPDGPDLGPDLTVVDAPGPDSPGLEQGAPDLPTPDLPTPDLPAPDLPAPDLPAPDLPAPDQATVDLTQPDVGDVCGDGKISGMEQCDGLLLGGSTCKSAGFWGGSLKCHPVTCLFDKTGCTNCGNGLLDANEQCEGKQLSGKTCKALKYDDGTLGCTSSCKFDTAACYDWLDKKPVTITGAAGDQLSPVVACTSAACLVVWESGGDLFGRIMDSGGKLGAAEITISKAIKAQKKPRVYADGNYFLVIWEDHRSAVPHIYGAKVTSGGKVLISSIYISSGTAGQTNPAAACDGTDCLVVWNEGALDIHGTLVRKNGVVKNTAGTRINTTSASKHSWLTVPTVTWDGKAYSVFWTLATNAYSWFNTMPVSATCTLGAAAEILILGSSTNNFLGAMIYEGPNHLLAQRHHVNSWGGYVKMTPVTPKYKLLSPTQISTSTNACCPALATDGKHTLLAWTIYTSGRRSIPAYSIGVRLTKNGAPVSAKSIVLFAPLSTGTGSPAVAHDGTRHLVVWHDKRSGHLDVLGMRIQFH